MSGAEDLQLKMWERSVDSMYKYLRNVANDGSVYLSENINGYRFLQSGELVSTQSVVFAIARPNGSFM
jgi:hypothetical protein